MIPAHSSGMKRLIIHGGVQRTGTTALQLLLSGNREAVEAAGYCYPGLDQNHQRWAWGLFSGKKTAQEFRDFLSDTSQDTVIVSAEGFCIHKDLSWLDKLKPLFGHIEAHFVLRRQDDWLMSWYNQHVRWPFDKRKSKMTPMEFLGTMEDYYWLDYYWLGNTWAGRLGAENVHMYPMSGDTARLLTDAMCPEAKLGPSNRDNASVPPQILEIVRHLDMGSLNRRQRAIVLGALGGVQKDGSTPMDIYPPAVRRMIRNKFSASNKAAFSAFVRNGQQSFEAKPTSNAGFYQPSLPSSETLLRDYIAPILKLI